MALSTTAEPAYGTLFNMCSDPSGGSPVTIGEVKDINFSLSSQIEDSTTHSTSIPVRTKVVTLLNVGPVEVMINWVPTDPSHNGTTGLYFVWRGREERSYQIEETDAGGTTLQWNGLISGIKQGRPVAGLRSANVSFEGTGDIDFDA